MKQNEDYRQFSVRIEIPFNAPFFSDTQKKATPMELLKYFHSEKFNSCEKKNKIQHVNSFLIALCQKSGVIKSYKSELDKDEGCFFAYFIVEVSNKDFDDLTTSFALYLYSSSA